MSLSKNLTVYIWSLIYKILLDLVFCLWISVKYGYMGFTLSFSVLSYLMSFVFFIITVVEAGRLVERGNPSDMTLLMLIYMYVFPQCTLCAFSKNDMQYFLYVASYFLLVYILNEMIHFHKFRFAGFETIDIWKWAIIIVGLVMIFISGYYSGFRITFDLSDYYEYRMEAREYSMPKIFQYIFEMTKTIIPIGLLYALINKKRLLVCFAAVCQILCFSFNGKKSVLFLFALVFLIYFFYKDVFKTRIAMVFSLLAVSTIAEILIRGGESFLGNKFMRRMMFLPSYLSWAYYDFFSVNELDYLRSSILRRIGLESPYGEKIPRIIGRMYFASDGGMNANNGLCGDAFSNFGWFSLIIYPLLVVLLLKYLENCLSDKDEKLKMFVCFLTAYMLISGSYFKCLLSGGLIIIGLLLSFSKKDKLSLEPGDDPCEVKKH